MKIMTVLGTRPEIIRLSLIIGKLDMAADHVLVHTGQNYDARLKDIFFDQLRVREPDHWLAVKADSFGAQIGQIMRKTEEVLLQEKPDRILFLGDTNSSVGAIIAKRMRIPVFHMEAGNRCYDDRVPEEVNRRIIDHSSDILLPYTERSRLNLLREGIEGERIYVTGNPIYEVLLHNAKKIDDSPILRQLFLDRQKYFLVTMHREENVDIEERLRSLVSALLLLQGEHKAPVIVSTHPRTRKRMELLGIEAGNADIRFLDPFGFFDFVALERNAACVLSDSGTVQEECCILGVPSVTIRDATERPEAVECGSSILSGVVPESVLRCAGHAMENRHKWTPPGEYRATGVSETVVNIMTGYLHRRWERT